MLVTRFISTRSLYRIYLSRILLVFMNFLPFESRRNPARSNCIAFTSKPTRTYEKARKWQRGNQFAQPSSGQSLCCRGSAIAFGKA
jgi:hypothetical protein